MKLDKILNIILISLGITVVGLVTFVGISANQDHATKHSNYAGSSKVSNNSKSSNNTAKSNKITDNKLAPSSSASYQFSEQKDKPNAGKVIKLNSVEEAEATIKQHEATCSYDNEPFYPGLVYTGTYTCKCGLKIIWWDKAMKESVDRDMESFSSKGIHGPEEYSYGTDDPWEKKTDSNPLPENQESTEISSTD
ncbi:hypothetical protein [Limosilactobacillus reuteri]|uniref:hypothetical protein n=2 Tax=Limosilactobacillus reuteri TaxID=1598 RepID=UPI001CDBCEBB|nr:hypothetical protein [Limosilactobacillus reuteri]